MDSIKTIKRKIADRLYSCVDAYASISAVYACVARAESDVENAIDKLTETGLFCASEIASLREFREKIAGRAILAARRVSRESAADTFKI